MQRNTTSSARPAAPQTQLNGTSSVRPAAPQTQLNGTSSARAAASQSQPNSTSSVRPAAPQTQPNSTSSARAAPLQTQLNGTSSVRPAAPQMQLNGTSSARPAAPHVSASTQPQRGNVQASNGGSVTQQRSAAPQDPRRRSGQLENWRVVLDPQKYTNLNLPADDADLPGPPIREIAPKDAESWIYLGHRIVASAWRAKPGTLQLAQLYADILVEDFMRVSSFLHHGYNDDLKLYIELHLPMIRVFKLGPEYHVLWNSDYEREHPNWAAEFQEGA